MVDLTEASQRVAVLEQFPFEDEQPNIEAPFLSVFFDGYIDYNYADRNAFDSRWTEETNSIAQLVCINYGILYPHFLACKINALIIS